jgi:ABC-type branched-subunit amino acid transport system substrate-binding protein
LLLGVATNDELTAKEESEERVVFRMVPNNSIQAQKIAAKAKTVFGEKTKRILLLYENNAYGSFLNKKVHEYLTKNTASKGDDKRTTVVFIIEDSRSIPTVMPLLERYKENADGIIYLGYADHAVSLLQALSGYKIQLPVILSDGCYSTSDPDLREVVTGIGFRVFLSFPGKAWPTNGESEDPPNLGFKPYGYNAYILLSKLANSINNTDPPTLKDAFNNASAALARDEHFPKTHLGFSQYTFKASGEPNAAIVDFNVDQVPDKSFTLVSRAN